MHGITYALSYGPNIDVHMESQQHAQSVLNLKPKLFNFQIWTFRKQYVGCCCFQYDDAA